METQKHAGEQDLLKRVKVRLVREEERGEFDFRLEEDHYLHSARLSGQTLRYVAEVDGQWVALLCFGAAALHLKAREQWIGWTPRQRGRRLAFMVNNSRFLVLPQRQKYPNLASRVMGLCLGRLSTDWQEQWEHPVSFPGPVRQIDPTPIEGAGLPRRQRRPLPASQRHDVFPSDHQTGRRAV